MIWLLTPVMGLLAFYSLIVVHCCAHDSFSRSKRANRLVGTVLSALNLFDFHDFRSLHALHHGHTNSPEKDPHYIRPGESWIHYVLTHYFRLIEFTYSPYYRTVFAKKDWEGYELDSPKVKRHDLMNRILGCSGRKPQFGYERILYSLSFGYLFWTIGIAWVLGEWKGLEAFAALLFVPVVIGQILVADFNWRGHVGLPDRDGFSDYHGQDTRSLYGGVWRFINWATFGFYLHREHHLDPRGACMFAEADAEVRARQELDFAAVDEGAAA